MDEKVKESVLALLDTAEAELKAGNAIRIDWEKFV